MRPIIVKKISFIFAFSLLFAHSSQAQTYHNIDIDAVFAQSDWSSKDKIKATIDDYTLLTTYQTEFNNCTTQASDISSCYDKVAEKILTDFYVYPAESLKAYQDFKTSLNNVYTNQFCTNKYAWPGGSLCSAESHPSTLKALHFYIQSLIDHCRQTLQSFLPALKDYR